MCTTHYEGGGGDDYVICELPLIHEFGFRL